MQSTKRTGQQQDMKVWGRLFVRIAVIVLAFVTLGLAVQTTATGGTPEPDAVPAAATLGTDWGTVPTPLWDGLLDLGYRGVQGDEAERLYVDLGQVVNVPGGLYLATVDGWMACADWATFDGECYGTGPVVPLGSGPSATCPP